MKAETVMLTGHDGGEINGYFARPLAPGEYPGVVVIHHNPGYDAATKEITRRFAANGYIALCPNLHYREAPGGNPDDASAIMRANGGVPDERCVGDAAGAAAYLRDSGVSNGKVGVIGFCSGGRQAYLIGAKVNVEAIVSCYGGNIVAGPDALTERMPVAPIDMTADLRAPLLGLYGADDKNPGPEAVERIKAELDKHGKEHEVIVFQDAGHGFFATDRPSYRPAAAVAGWQHVMRWFGKHLATKSH